MAKEKKSQPLEMSEPVAEKLSDIKKPEREEPGFRVNGRDGADETKRIGTSVSLKVQEDGSLDPSTRESTLRKLQEVIQKTPSLQAKLLGKTSGVALVEPKAVEPFYTGIGLLNTFLAIRILKLDSAVAQTIIPYSVPELKLLSEATAEAVNENLDKMPAWLLELLRGGGSVALAKLAMVLFQVHAQKLAAIRQAMGQAAEQRPAAVN